MKNEPTVPKLELMTQNGDDFVRINGVDYEIIRKEFFNPITTINWQPISRNNCIGKIIRFVLYSPDQCRYAKTPFVIPVECHGRAFDNDDFRLIKDATFFATDEDIVTVDDI